MKRLVKVLVYELLRRNAILIVHALYGNIWRLRECITGNGVRSALYYYYFAQHGASIGLGALIHDIPTFPHGFFGIFISEAAKIGKGVVIFHQVTIGSNTIKSSKHYGAPIIEDGVYIGCGAKIIGGGRIGKNARIGANCVVVNDVPANAVVVSSKNRQIEHDKDLINEFNPIK